LPQYLVDRAELELEYQSELAETEQESINITTSSKDNADTA